MLIRYSQTNFSFFLDIRYSHMPIVMKCVWIVNLYCSHNIISPIFVFYSTTSQVRGSMTSITRISTVTTRPHSPGGTRSSVQTCSTRTITPNYKIRRLKRKPTKQCEPSNKASPVGNAISMMKGSFLKPGCHLRNEVKKVERFCTFSNDRTKACKENSAYDGKVANLVVN